MKHLVNFNESNLPIKSTKMDKYKSLEQRIKDIKDDMLNEILNDNELSKLEKLELISNKLFITAGSIREPFSKYYAEFKEIIRRNPAYDAKYGAYRNWDPSIDDIFCNGDMYDRHQIIDLSRVAIDAFDYYDDGDDDDESEKKIIILTNRSTTDKFKITQEEFIDCIYDWCIANKTIAFEMDW